LLSQKEKERNPTYSVFVLYSVNSEFITTCIKEVFFFNLSPARISPASSLYPYDIFAITKRIHVISDEIYYLIFFHNFLTTKQRTIASEVVVSKAMKQ
jgi:hypothetical protein